MIAHFSYTWNRGKLVVNNVNNSTTECVTFIHIFLHTRNHHYWSSVPRVLWTSPYQDDVSDRCSVAGLYHTHWVNSRQDKVTDFIFPGLSKSPHLHRGLHSHALPTAGPPYPPQTWLFSLFIPLFLSPISNTLIHNNNPLAPTPQHTKLLHRATHVLPICFSFVECGGFSDLRPLFFVFTHPHLSSHGHVYKTWDAHSEYLLILTQWILSPLFSVVYKCI